MGAALSSLRSEWAAAGSADEAFLEALFPREGAAMASHSHIEVEKALAALHDALGKQPDAVLANLDLVLKYAAARTYARKTTTVSATQVLLRDVLTYLADAGVSLGAKEAGVLLPSLLDNAGATREANRLAYRQILDLLPPVMGARAFVRQVLGAVEELSNKRSQAESLRAIGSALEACAGRFNV